MRQMLRDITVRKMVIYVLLLISTLIGVMLLLNARSLQNAQALEQQNQLLQQETTELHRANDQLLRARLRMARQKTYAQSGDQAGLAAETKSIDAAVETSTRHFENFLRNARQHAPAALLSGLQAEFHRVMNEGIQQQRALLTAADFAKADAHEIAVVVPASRAFSEALSRYETHAQEQGLQRAQMAANDRQMTMSIAAFILAICLIIVFLGDRYIVACVKKPLDDIKAHFQRIESGDLTKPIIPFGKNCIGQIIPHLQDMQASLARTVGSVRDGVVQINGEASEISEGNVRLAARTDEQASSVVQTASSMEELSATVRHNAQNANKARDMSQQATQAVQRGGGAVQEAVATMRKIAESSKRIDDITSLIDGIAFQTNILALNAAVEAARAGEQGRGFAVVAGEVRVLAQRSAVAAKDIKTLISTSNASVAQGAQQVEVAGATMDETLEAVRRLSALVNEIATACGEQATGLEQINTAVMQIDQITQQNATAVEQAAEAASSLQAQTQRLTQSVALFQLPAIAGAAPRLAAR